MNKIIFFMFFLSILVYGELINAVAVTVNDEIITIYDIKQKMKSLSMSKEQAANVIMDEILAKKALELNNIIVEESEIDGYISKIAKSNNLSFFEFVNLVKEKQSYKIFRENIKFKIEQNILSQKIVAKKIRQASEEDIQKYYNENIEQFGVPSKIEVIRYTAKDKNLLIEVSKNPLFLSPDIQRANETIDLKNIDEQIGRVISSTKDGHFTKIGQGNNIYIMFYVKKKTDDILLPIEKVRDGIFELIMTKRQNKILENYFNDLRFSAKIKVIR